MAADTRSELPEYHLPKAWFWKVIWRFRSYYYQVILATVIINFRLGQLVVCHERLRPRHSQPSL